MTLQLCTREWSLNPGWPCKWFCPKHYSTDYLGMRVPGRESTLGPDHCQLNSGCRCMQSLSLGNLAQRVGAVPPGTLPLSGTAHTPAHHSQSLAPYADRPVQIPEAAPTVNTRRRLGTSRSRIQRHISRIWAARLSESGPLQMRPIRDGRGSLLLLAPGFHGC